MSSDRELDLVELVDEDGDAIGQATVAEAHTDPPKRHRAFSVLLFDDSGRVMLQRRAAVKTRFANRWANTACGHPAPGEDLVAAAAKRLGEEMGLHDVTLHEVGRFAYQHADPATGRVEHEYDHVLIGATTQRPNPDPAEVSEWRWAAPGDLHSELGERPDAFAPWLVHVLRVAADAGTP